MRRKKIMSVFVSIVLILTAFFAGGLLKEQKNRQRRKEHCRALIDFALEKNENRDISNPGVMKAMISNVYAAYNFCEDSIMADELYNLWNDLIFKNESYDTIRSNTQRKLKDISQRLRESK